MVMGAYKVLYSSFVFDLYDQAADLYIDVCLFIWANFFFVPFLQDGKLRFKSVVC